MGHEPDSRLAPALSGIRLDELVSALRDRNHTRNAGANPRARRRFLFAWTGPRRADRKRPAPRQRKPASVLQRSLSAGSRVPESDPHGVVEPARERELRPHRRREARAHPRRSRHRAHGPAARRDGLPRRRPALLRARVADLSARRRALVGYALSDPLRSGGLDRDRAASSTSSTRRIRGPCPDYGAAAEPGQAVRPPPRIPSSTVLQRVAPQCDVVYYGKWTAYRDGLVAALASRFLGAACTRTRARGAGACRPCRRSMRRRRCAPALNRARLALETALFDDAEGRYRGAYRITPRAFFAASCGVPSLIESRRPDGVLRAQPRDRRVHVNGGRAVVARAERLLADEPARAAMGPRARQRALREHTWDRRVEEALLDVRKMKAPPGRCWCCSSTCSIRSTGRARRVVDPIKESLFGARPERERRQSVER